MMVLSPVVPLLLAFALPIHGALLGKHGKNLDGAPQPAIKYLPHFDRYVNHGDPENPQGQLSAQDALKNFVDPDYVFPAVNSDAFLLKCVWSYTGKAAWPMNTAARKDDEELLKTWGLAIQQTRQAFSLKNLSRDDFPLDVFSGTVYRGIALGPESVRDSVWAQYQPEKEIVWEAFSSTATTHKSKDADDYFWQQNTKFEIAVGKMLHRVENTTSQDNVFLPAQISKVSQYANQDEVLLPPYSHFRVVAVKKWSCQARSHPADPRTPQPCKYVWMETTEFPSVGELVEQKRWADLHEKLGALYSEEEEEEEDSALPRTLRSSRRNEEFEEARAAVRADFRTSLAKEVATAMGADAPHVGKVEDHAAGLRLLNYLSAV